MTTHTIVTREKWLEARLDLLAAEKDLTRRSDEVARLRRQLPWVPVEKNYVFEGPDGREKLADLFDGRSQLIVQQFMLAPGWEQGCKSCSFMADHTDGMTVHLAHRDATMVAISRAPIAEIERFRRRMGWQFKWVSSYGTDFNYERVPHLLDVRPWRRGDDGDLPDARSHAQGPRRDRRGRQDGLGSSPRPVRA